MDPVTPLPGRGPHEGPSAPDPSDGGSSPAGDTGPGDTGPGDTGPGHGGGRTAGLRRGARSAARGVATGGRVLGGGVRAGWSRIERFTTSGGAGRTGLAKLVHLQFFTAAGDAAIAVALAGTIFFALPVDQARPQVAQFLLLTMAPFAIVAPFIGPFLDRFRQGRRWAIGVTLALRGFLCWVLAEEIQDNSVWVFPAALGCLVASKAYTVTGASAVPRLLPPGFTLVNANSRISLMKVAGAAVGGGAAAGFAKVGAPWALRFAFLVFVVGTVLAILLPKRVDSSAGERDIGGMLALPPARGDEAPAPLGEKQQRRFRSLHPSVLHGLKCVLGARLMTGFLTLFLAFLLRAHPIADLDGTLVLGIVVAAAGVGNSLGTVLGNLLKDRSPAWIAFTALCVDAGMAVTTATLYGLVTVIAMGLTAGLCAQLAKLSYDALVQAEVPEGVRTSVFARSETVFQISWVCGGGLGIVLPLVPRLGFGLIAALLLAVIAWALVARRRARPV